MEWDHPNKQVFLSQTVLIDCLVFQYRQTDATPLMVPMEPGLKLRWMDRSKLSSEDMDKLEWIPYHNLVGGLLWLAVSMCPDI